MNELYLTLLLAGYAGLLLLTARTIRRARQSARHMLRACAEHAADAKRHAVGAAVSAELVRGGPDAIPFPHRDMNAPGLGVIPKE